MKYYHGSSGVHEEKEEEKEEEKKNLLTHGLTGWLKSRSRILPDKPTGTHLVKKFPAFCRTQNSFTRLKLFSLAYWS